MLGHRSQAHQQQHGCASGPRQARCRVRVATAMVDPVTLPDDSNAREMEARRQALTTLYASPDCPEEPEPINLLPPAQEAPPAVDPPREGDIVYGTVTWSNGRGARVKLTGYDNINGYMHEHYSPVPLPFRIPPRHMRHNTMPHHEHQPPAPQPEQEPASATLPTTTTATTTTDSEAAPDVQPDAPAAPAAPKRKRHVKKHAGRGDSKAWEMPVGTMRPFVVMATQPGKNLLLSALAADYKVMLTRMAQLKELYDEEQLTMRATLVDYNSGGCLCSILGLYSEAFMPYGQLQHAPQDGSRFWSPQNAHLLMGCEVDVVITQVDVAAKKVVVSERVAEELRAARVLQLGNAVAGTVDKVFDWGMRVRLHAVHGAYADAPRQRMTRARAPPYPSAMFRAGDHVVGLLSHVGEESHVRMKKLELSLMELEEKDGDMLKPASRTLCFEKAAAYTTS